MRYKYVIARLAVARKWADYYYFLILLSINIINFNPIRSGMFQTANDPGGGGGALKANLLPPLRSQKLLY